MALRAAFANGYEVIETVHRHPGEGQMALDLGDGAMIRTTLASARPDVVLIAGAFCHVDLCETEPQACRLVNVEGTKAVARYAREQGGAGRVLFHGPGV